MQLVSYLTTWLIVIIYLNQDVTGQTLRDGVMQGMSRYGKSSSRTFVRKCGSALNEALLLICNGVYNSLPAKKNDETATQQTEDSWMNTDENYALYPFRSRRSALAFGTDSAFRRRSRGIVDECCYKYCTVREMYSYCGR